MKNVPKLRFKGFSGEWQAQKLGDFSTFSKGKGISKADIDPNGINPCIRYGELYTVYGEKIDNVLSKTNVDIKNLVVSEVNDIIIPASGETQIDIAKASCVLKSGIALGGDLNIIKTNKNGVFLSYYLNSKKKLDIAKLAQGKSVVHLYPSQLEKLDVNTPSDKEQTKIADFLTAIDDRISQLSQKCDGLAQYKKGVMQQIFSQELRFKDEQGRAFPAWDSVDLGDLAFKVNTKNKDDSISKVLTNSAVQGIVSQNDFFDKDIANKNNLEGYYVVELNDFVYNPRISSSAPVGPIKRNKLAKGVMSPLYTVFRFKSGCLDFLEYFFETTYWHDHMKSVSNMGARFDRMNITNEGFFALPIALPSIAEQEKIAGFLSAVDEKISHAQAQLEALKQYKQGLLQQMFV
ncbi:restriction endonuclease subunit S [Thiothrix lacustris]|uniref:restriction endonuclease subunit S n=1 Tax=Thiothrix lacustris TaxID=525917 RepID=UPI0027E56A68|nr:restriction endonuclease subunit S [Thiothrix lacustris]WMP15634.1 restriction endonuclease subunit S [Thiothrix lacustris]